jgi:hypothetical protein
MKSVSFLFAGIIIPFALFFFPIFQNSALGQEKIRIGTYDSRAVAIAYFNSPCGKQVMELMGTLQKKKREALEANDTLIIKKLNREGEMRQAIMHEQGFGTGSVKDLLVTIKDKIGLLAKSENLDIIVSKYELTYFGSDSIVIDITEKLTNLFEPNLRFKTILPDLLKNEPVKDAYLDED